MQKVQISEHLPDFMPRKATRVILVLRMWVEKNREDHEFRSFFVDKKKDHIIE